MEQWISAQRPPWARGFEGIARRFARAQASFPELHALRVAWPEGSGTVTAERVSARELSPPVRRRAWFEVVLRAPGYASSRFCLATGDLLEHGIVREGEEDALIRLHRTLWGLARSVIQHARFWRTRLARDLGPGDVTGPCVDLTIRADGTLAYWELHLFPPHLHGTV